MLADRPVLFSAPMIRALLDGRKTMTRRIIKPQPEQCAGTDGLPLPVGLIHVEGDRRPRISIGRVITRQEVRYAGGDRLWVKEGWADEHPLAIQAERYSQPGRAGIPGPPGVAYRTIYRVDGEPLQIWRTREPEHPYFTRERPSDEGAAEFPTVLSNYTRSGKGIYWGSSRYMPRWASRLTLLVEAVKVERLQDISEADAQAEGVSLAEGFGWTVGGNGYDDPVSCFRALWNGLHGPEAWLQNPWVAAIRFSVHRCNIDAMEAPDAR